MVFERLARKTKYETVVGWVNGEKETPNGLTALGDRLYSYGMLIAERRNDGQHTTITVYGGRAPSRTTAKHIGWIRKAASMWGVPLIEQ